jgi:hypothetical protein
LRNLAKSVDVLNFDFSKREGAMHLSLGRRACRLLPKRFPVGTTYVVEGRGGENGNLRVFSRYLVLPGGQRINLAADFAGPAASPGRRSRSHGAKQRPARLKKKLWQVPEPPVGMAVDG